MAVPLALGIPAAAAGLAYINARTSAWYDYTLMRSAIASSWTLSSREKKDRLNLFYILEDFAKSSKSANRPLLIFEGRTWTYKEVYETALKYGTWLKNTYSVKPKEIVGMDFMNSDKFILTWLGLWSIGARPAFLNYNLGSKALVHCIKVSTARLVLVDIDVDKVTPDVVEELPGIEFVSFTPELESAAMNTDAVREPDSVRCGQGVADLAALIYTSGTTGLPKPAVVSWTKVITGPTHVASWMGLRNTDTFYTCMPLYHSSAAVLGFCNVLNIGATLSIGRKFSTKTFWKEIRASKATVVQYVGETCRYLLAAPPQFDANGENLDKKHHLRMAFGNGLRPDIWDEFKTRFGIDAIAEFYAATEGTAGTFNYSRNAYSAGAIGRAGTLTKFLMSKRFILVKIDLETEEPWRDPITGLCERMPSGETGELMFALDPANISRNYQGYFNNSKASQSKIFRDVLVKGDAFFRTGDLIRFDNDGRTYFSDRIGDTFRWKSENVSTNEVSELLGNHPAIVEANVFGVELPHHDGRAGCVTAVLKQNPTPQVLSSLAQHAQRQLPRFAVPIFLRVAKNMEITGTNKQQKHVLRGQGVDPKKTGDDLMFWLNGGSYVKFTEEDWTALNGGKIKL